MVKLIAVEALLYLLARALVALLQALPLTWVARLGRLGGGLAYWLDARHRRVALRNLAMCFGQEQSPAQLRALARENFRRIGENYACAIKTASMSYEELRARVEFVGNPRIISPPADQQAPERRRRHRPFRELRVVCPVRPICAGLQVRHHLPRFASGFS